MLFPLTTRKLIRGFDAHIAAGLGGAADYVADMQPLYGPCDGILYPFKEAKGGNWLRITRENGERIEFAHLNEYRFKNKKCKAGDLLAITGNTGTETSGPHLHIQVFSKEGERLDPEKYFSAFNIPVVAVNASIKTMQDLQAEVLKYSQGMLTISWDIIDNPIYVGTGLLTQGEAYHYAYTLYQKKYDPYRFLFLFYNGNTTSTFLATYFYPKQKNAISTIVNGADPKLIAFEFGHALQIVFNEYRGTLPPIQIIDSNFPTDNLIIEKYRSILPFTDVLLKV